MVRVKVCGITNLEDALVAVVAGADAVGFNFWPHSRRHIAPHRAAEIIARLPPFVTPVGVFVNAAPKQVERLAATTGVRMVQLHGDESAEEVASLARRGLAVLKTFHVGTQFRPQQLRRYPAVAGFLLDTDVRGRRGGTGETFDWQVARQAKRYGRVLLAGGLKPENVAEAVRHAQPYGVDVCTGVEEKPGLKNHALLREFIQRAKGVQGL